MFIIYYLYERALGKTLKTFEKIQPKKKKRPLKSKNALYTYMKEAKEKH